MLSSTARHVYPVVAMETKLAQGHQWRALASGLKKSRKQTLGLGARALVESLGAMLGPENTPMVCTLGWSRTTLGTTLRVPYGLEETKRGFKQM